MGACALLLISQAACVGHGHSSAVPVCQGKRVPSLGWERNQAQHPPFPLQTLRLPAETCLAPVAACELLSVCTAALSGAHPALSPLGSCWSLSSACPATETSTCRCLAREYQGLRGWGGGMPAADALLSQTQGLECLPGGSDSAEPPLKPCHSDAEWEPLQEHLPEGSRQRDAVGYKAMGFGALPQAGVAHLSLVTHPRLLPSPGTLTLCRSFRCCPAATLHTPLP